MDSVRSKTVLKRKIDVKSHKVLPQLPQIEEKPEWRNALSEVKGATSVIKRETAGIDLERKHGVKRKRRVDRIGFWAMLEKREKFRSELIKIFKPNEVKEHNPDAPSRGLTPQERQWLRYEYYLRKIIPIEHVACLTENDVKRILNLVPEKLKVNMEDELQNIMQQIKDEYIWVVKKAAVDSLQISPSVKESAYDPTSRYNREMSLFLKISLPAIKLNKKKLAQNYVLSNKCILRLLDVWLQTCDKLSFIDCSNLKRDEPYETSVYLQTVKMQVLNIRKILHHKWFPLVQRTMNIGLKKYIPEKRKDTFFNCVAAIMTSQLKRLLLDSLINYEKIACNFQEYIGSFKIKLLFQKGNYRLEPDVGSIERALIEPFNVMQLAIFHVPRVETCLDKPFTESMKHSLKTALPENVIEGFKAKVIQSLLSEWKRPVQFMEKHMKFKFLLSNEAEEDLNSFLENEHTLLEYEEKVEELTTIKLEIELQRGKTVQEGMFVIQIEEFFESLYNAVSSLCSKLIHFLAEKHAAYTTKYV